MYVEGQEAKGLQLEVWEEVTDTEICYRCCQPPTQVVGDRYLRTENLAEEEEPVVMSHVFVFVRYVAETQLEPWAGAVSRRGEVREKNAPA